MDNLEELLDSSPVVQAQWDLGRRPISLHRPAVVAPGVRIVSTQRADHDYQLLSMAGDPDPLYGVRTGTSMAAPHAAGVAALMVEAYRRNHRGTDPSPLDLIGALELSADRSVVYDSDARDAGAGLVDAVAAVRLTRRSPVASAQKDPDLEPVHPALTTTRGGILRGTLDVPSVALTAGTALAPASVHEVSVPAGTWLLSAQVVDAPANAFEVSLYPPGAPRPAVQSADNYAPRSTTTPRPAVAFPSPGTWTIRVERSATTPPGPFAVEWKTEAPPA